MNRTRGGGCYPKGHIFNLCLHRCSESPPALVYPVAFHYLHLVICYSCTFCSAKNSMPVFFPLSTLLWIYAWPPHHLPGLLKWGSEHCSKDCKKESGTLTLPPVTCVIKSIPGSDHLLQVQRETSTHFGWVTFSLLVSSVLAKIVQQGGSWSESGRHTFCP